MSPYKKLQPKRRVSHHPRVSFRVRKKIMASPYRFEVRLRHGHSEWFCADDPVNQEVRVMLDILRENSSNDWKIIRKTGLRRTTTRLLLSTRADLMLVMLAQPRPLVYRVYELVRPPALDAAASASRCHSASSLKLDETSR